MNKYKSITVAISYLEKRGYTDRWRYAEEDCLQHSATEACRTLEELQIIEFHRYPDPMIVGDSVAIFAIESKENERGLLIARYNSSVNMELINFLDKLPIKKAKS